jgi:hypothetical protein
MSASVSVMTGARYSEAKPFATCLEGGASSFAKASAGRGCRRRRWITERRGHAVSGGDGAPPSNTLLRGQHAQGCPCGGGAGFDAQLGEKIIGVFLDGVDRRIKDDRDFRIGLSFCHPVEHFCFSRC